MKTKIIIIDKNDRDTTEIFATDPFTAIQLDCQLKKYVINIGKLLKTNTGYEYLLKNGDILIAENC